MPIKFTAFFGILLLLVVAICGSACETSNDIDDDDMRLMIEQDVSEVLNTLLDNNWMILDEQGEPTNAGPNVLPVFQIAWLTIGYHITGEQRLAVAVKDRIKNSYRTTLRLSGISFFNRYLEYYGNCLAHEAWNNLLRLGKVYFSQDDYAFLVLMFNQQVHTFTRLSHNPWFNGVYMGQGGYEPSAPTDPYQEQLVQDLEDFSDAPRYRDHVPARDPSTYTLDPVSVFLHDLIVQYPFIGSLIGNVNYQATEPFEVPLQCPADFMFQWNPYRIDECGNGDLKMVDPGVDFLIPYWLASYHKFLTRQD